MLGRLVRRMASRCASTIPCASASRRRGRWSGTLFSQLRHETAQCQLVSVRAEAAQYRGRGPGQHGVPALGLARKNVCQVDFDEGHVDGSEGVTNGETRMRVGACVDQCAIRIAAHRVNTVDELSFPVMLRKLDLGAELVGHDAKPLLDVIECRATVNLRLTRAEQVEARPI